MKKLITLVILFAFATLNYAGDPARKGTTGASQLLVPVGAQGIATGGAMLSNLKGIESIYYNPAGLDYSSNAEAMFSYMSYFADINVSYFAASTKLEGIGSLGLSIKTFDIGDIPVTTNDYPDGTGSTYSPTFMTVALTYSKIITDRISVGANFKLITESIENSTANGFGLDFGVQYRFDSQLSLAASVKNIGSNMRYSGGLLQASTSIPNTTPGAKPGVYEIVAEEFQIPSFFEMSLSYDYIFNEQNNLLVGTTYTANNALEDIINIGGEYSFMKMLFLRGGYRMYTENNKNSPFGFTLGAGVKYDVLPGVGLVFDYAFQEVKEFPTSNHIFTVKFELK